MQRTRCVSVVGKYPHQEFHPMSIQPRARRRLIRVLAALGIAATLGGCIVVPVGGGYYRPHPYRYFY